MTPRPVGKVRRVVLGEGVATFRNFTVALLDGDVSGDTNAWWPVPFHLDHFRDVEGKRIRLVAEVLPPKKGWVKRG